MYLPIGCLMHYHQGVEGNFAQREIEFLSYVVMNEVVNVHEEG